MSPGNTPDPAAEDVLASVRRLVREAQQAPDLAQDRLVLTPSHRVDEGPRHAEVRPAPVLVLSEVLRAASPPAALSIQPQEPAAGPAQPLDEATVRRIVAEAVREALGERAIRDLVRREVLLMLSDRED